MQVLTVVSHVFQGVSQGDHVMPVATDMSVGQLDTQLDSHNSPSVHSVHYVGLSYQEIHVASHVYHSPFTGTCVPLGHEFSQALSNWNFPSGQLVQLSADVYQLPHEESHSSHRFASLE